MRIYEKKTYTEPFKTGNNQNVYFMSDLHGRLEKVLKLKQKVQTEFIKNKEMHFSETHMLLKYFLQHRYMLEKRTMSYWQ